MLLPLLVLACVSAPSRDSGDTGQGEPLDPYEEPIRLVLKVHVEPQSDAEEGYRRRLETVEAVRALAEGWGAPLTVHANPDFWQLAAAQGDGELVRGWAEAGHDVGPHMHPIHEEVDGSGEWTYTTEEDWDDAGVREIWDDHVRSFRALFGEEQPLDQATPWNNQGSEYVDLMAEYGFSISGGGRHEIAVPWLGHHPFHPWRLGHEFLVEDLSSPVLIVHHQPQIGTAKHHGQEPGRVFEDQRVPHLKVQLLQVYLNRLHAERTGDGHDRIWLFGFLTHDYAGDAETLAELAEFVEWTLATFDTTSLRGNPVIAWADFTEVSEAYASWEAAHPGVSSFHTPTPDPVAEDDLTAITERESRRIYPHPFWGMARLLAADGDTVVDWVREVEGLEPLGVRCHELEHGHRRDEVREPRWLCWREADGTVMADLEAATGTTALTRYDPRTGAGRQVDSSAVEIGPLPVILDRRGAR